MMKEPGERIRVLIVDDSLFSRHLIVELLDPRWFEIVGFADGFRSALESYRTYRPDVITMDIVTPEMDGIEVTERIIAEEPSAKVVILSRVSNPEMIELAKSKGAEYFLTKPIDAEELMNTIRNVCGTELAPEVSFNNSYPNDFLASFITFMKRFSPELVVETISPDARIFSNGIAIIIGVTGQLSGRVVLDLSNETAHKMATRLLKQEPKNTEQVKDVIAELVNIIAGNASSQLNKNFRTAVLRVAPPGIFSGDHFLISSQNLELNLWEIATSFGKVRLSVGFKKERSEWTQK